MKKELLKPAQEKKIKKQKIHFKYKGFKHNFFFTPKEGDEWHAFNSKELDFDVHYCTDYKQIAVYEVINGEPQIQKTIYKKAII